MRLDLRSAARLLQPGILLAMLSVAGAWEDSSAWIHRAWQTEDGLPDNDITGVVQTDDGYVWISTKAGLLRFNGTEFTPFPLIQIPGVPSRAVRAMYRDSRSRLWLAMERGPVLCVEAGGIRAYGPKQGMLNQLVLSMAEDHEGGIWVVYGSRLRRILGDKVEHIQLPQEMQDGSLPQLTTDAAGDLWVASGQRVGVYRGGEIQLVLESPHPVVALFRGAGAGLWLCAGGRLMKWNEGNELIDHVAWPGRDAPLAVLEDAGGALWIGTPTDGLFRLEGTGMERVPTSHQAVTCLMEDREGNLWAGTTGGGVNLIRRRTAGLIGPEEGLPFESAQSVCEDSSGQIWVVSQAGALARGRDGRWELIEAQQGWQGGSATCVGADAQGGVWVGTRETGLWQFHDGQFQSWNAGGKLPNSGIRSLLVDTEGSVWVALTMPERLLRFRASEFTELERPRRLGAIRALVQDNDGTIWIGTAEGQLLRVSGSRLVNEPAVRAELTLSIRALHVTPDGGLWIGYAGDGLGLLKDGRHARVTTTEGLRDDFVSQVLSDDTGSLWVVGNRGLSRLSLPQVMEVMAGREDRLRSRVYGRNDGLPSFQPNRDHSPASCRTRTGRLLFSTRSGLLDVEPGNIQDNPDPPPVILESVSVDDQPVALYGAGALLPVRTEGSVADLRAATPALRLAPNHRKLEFQFAGLSYSSPENVQFRHRLVGVDQKWIETGGDRRTTYPRLPAGDYEFRVLACNNADVWNETGYALPITVLPFVWERWWFKAGGGMATALLAGGSVFVVARRRYRRKLSRLEARRAVEQERARIAKDIHDDLGAGRTRISLLRELGGQGGEAADSDTESLKAIHTTARQLTQAMGEVVWAINPEHDTLDGLVNYLSNYAQSFLKVAGVRCRMNMPLQLPPHPLLAEQRHSLFLAFKEALNNVVKHARATEVRITLTPQERRFSLVIEDDGQGFVARAREGRSGGNGLNNMQSRLREIGGACTVRSAPGMGTRVEFEVLLKPGPQPA